MENDTYIDFLLVIKVEGMHFSPHCPEGIEFKPEEDDSLRFVLRPTDPEEDASGHRKGLSCRVYKSYPATKDQMIFVDSYINRRVMTRIADNVCFPYKLNDKVLIAEDGSFEKTYHPSRHICPSDIANLIEQVESDLTAKANRFFKVLRWRQDCDAPSEVLKHQSLYWRVDEGPYLIVPPNNKWRQTTIHGMFGIHWSERHATDLQKLWREKDITEPLGHTLLREAAVLTNESPRSSILIMTAALETAVKTHISRIVPDTAWLMEEIPSPPIFKVLRDYIPLINRNCGKELDFWDKIKPSIKKVQKLIELRNKVAHTGKIPEDAESIQDYTELVSDFLYLLDVLDGHEWAKSFISLENRKMLGWPDPIDGRFTLTVTEGY